MYVPLYMCSPILNPCPQAKVSFTQVRQALGNSFVSTPDTYVPLLAEIILGLVWGRSSGSYHMPDSCL